MHHYLFILGRQKDLTLLELKCVFSRLDISSKFVFSHPNSVTIQSQQKLNTEKLMRTLGGTIKIAKISQETTPQHLIQNIVKLLKKENRAESKIRFGISAVGLKDPEKIHDICKKVKEKLGKDNINSRYLLPKANTQLTSAQVQLGKTSEINIIFSKDKILLAETKAVQDFQAFSKRDYGRPYSNPREGMLPPKVSRMMINIALEKESKEDTWIADPFCGTGTIAMEAMVLRINSINSDFSSEKIQGTSANLSWLKQKLNSKVQWEVFKADATHLSSKLDIKVDAIVTEPYLGPPNIRATRVVNIIKGLNKLYIGCLKDWKKILKPKGRVAIALPQFAVGGTVRSANLVIDRREKLGYTLDAGPFIYARPKAKVRREIYLLQAE